LTIFYIVILSLLFILLLFGASYLLAIILNKFANTDWKMNQELTPAGKDSDYDHEDRP
jgi:hypothetical protein